MSVLCREREWVHGRCSKLLLWCHLVIPDADKSVLFHWDKKMRVTRNQVCILSQILISCSNSWWVFWFRWRQKNRQKPKAIKHSNAIPFLGLHTIFSLSLSNRDSKTSHPLLAQTTLCYPQQRPTIQVKLSRESFHLYHQETFPQPSGHKTYLILSCKYPLLLLACLLPL